MLRFCFFLTLVAIGLYFAARVYLRSEGTKQRVVSSLKEITGAPVELEDADIGVLGGTTLHGLRLYQTSKGDDEPWVDIGTVETDISAIDLLRGVMPKKLTLRDPAVTLHLDRSGQLLTHLPEGAGLLAAPEARTLPDVRIVGGKATVRQDGRPALVVQGVGLTLRPESNRIVLSGSVSDSDWGDWSLDGSLNQADRSLSVTLRTDRAVATQQKLLSLPCIPDAVWREVEAAGPTAVDFTFRYDPKGPAHYRVALSSRRSVDCVAGTRPSPGQRSRRDRHRGWTGHAGSRPGPRLWWSHRDDRKHL